MKTKWIDVQVTPRLFKRMRAGEISGIEDVTNPKKKEKSVPYLEVIYTGTPSKGHWENPEKVLFPAFCMFCERGGGLEKLGVINVRYEGGTRYYHLHDCSMQWSDVNTNYKYTEIAVLFKEHNVEIVKAKIIVKRG